MRNAALVLVLLALVACTARHRAPEERSPGVRGVTAGSAGAIGDSASLEFVEVIRSDFDPMDPRLRQALTNTARAAMARWEGNRPNRYQLRVLELGSCFAIRTSEMHPARREVYEIAGDSIVGSTLEIIPDSLRRACWQRWRVEDLFARLFTELAHRSVTVEGIEYDPQYWYPRRYRVTGGPHGPTLLLADHFDARSP